MTKKLELPDPECDSGYTVRQLQDILGDRFDEFFQWMTGQTMSLCNGHHRDPATGQYEDTGIVHGTIVYPGDLRGFLTNQPITD